MEGWVCPLTHVADNTGDATQLYPAWCTAETAPASATPANQVRQPSEGTLFAVQVEADGSNGGTLQIYDCNGMDYGVDVSSATAITATQLNALVTAGKARLILEQGFAGSGLTPWAPIGPRAFMKGLVGRFIGASGSCSVNLSVRGGYRKLNGTV